ATAMGRGGANILTLEVVERQDGYAVDDMSVEAPAGMQDALRRAAEEVPSLVVEEVRPADAFREALTPMELAARLAESPAGAMTLLVEHLADALWASWAMAIDSGTRGLVVIASSIGAPPLEDMRTPWLPLDSARRLARAPWMPTRWRTGIISRAGVPSIEAAAAPLYGPHSAVLVARKRGPRFRGAEIMQLGALSRIAAAGHSNISVGEAMSSPA
ncbi:MAG: hypothetical protein ACRDIA_05695, partial [Actinomycetota bacterium]